MKISHHDELELHRFLDGELDAAASAAFRARCEAEPALRQRLVEERAMRAAFAAARGVPTGPSTGFTASVIAAVRQLPARREIEEREAGEAVVRLCRRLLVAALIVFGLGAAWHGGLLDSDRGNLLEAAPDEIRTEMERLDALIESGALDAGKAGERRPK
jgi:anti-sigma factor RsiW